MILATGWTADELRAQPARLVRAIAWRLFAARTWSPELAQAAAAPAPLRSAFGDVRDWATAQRARVEAKTALAEIEKVLWPEED